MGAREETEMRKRIVVVTAAATAAVHSKPAFWGEP
jgi:hypothetical protein